LHPPSRSAAHPSGRSELVDSAPSPDHPARSFAAPESAPGAPPLAPEAIQPTYHPPLRALGALDAPEPPFCTVSGRLARANHRAHIRVICAGWETRLAMAILWSGPFSEL